MKFAFIAARDVAFPVSTMCRVLDVTRSGFYAWQKRPKPARAKRDAHLAATVAAVHQRSLAKNRSLWSRIHTRLSLGEAASGDTAEYLGYRLKHVGADRELFSSRRHRPHPRGNPRAPWRHRPSRDRCPEARRTPQAPHRPSRTRGPGLRRPGGALRGLRDPRHISDGHCQLAVRGAGYAMAIVLVAPDALGAMAITEGAWNAVMQRAWQHHAWP